MKKFRFRLERVLQYRELVKRDRKRELAAKTMQLQTEQERLNELGLAWEANGIPSGPIPAEMLQLVERYSMWLKAAIEKQQKTVAEAKQAVEEARNAYIEAAKESEALKTLKTKKREEYLEYYYKEEGKFLDEISVQRAKMNKSAGELTYGDETETEWDDQRAGGKAL